MDWTAYFVLGGMLMAAAGLAGLELLLSALGWRARWWPRAFFLASTPLAQTVFDWNPSTLVFLACAGTVFLMVRGKYLAGGALLALASLKVSVGLPVALVLLAVGVDGLTAPLRLRARAAAGFVAALVALVLAQVALAGPRGMAHWWSSLSGMGLHLGMKTPGHDPYRQTELAGLPALLLDHVPLPLAMAAAAAAVLVFVVWAVGTPAARARLRQEPLLVTGLALAATLCVLPYLHINDLVLEALPLLILVSVAPRPLSRVTLLAWFLGTPIWFVFALLASALFHVQPEGTVGFGLLLTSLTLVSTGTIARASNRPVAHSPMRPSAGGLP